MYLWFLESHVYLTIASEPLSSLLRVFLGCVCQLEVLVQEWDCVENKSQKDQKAEKSWDTYTKVIVIFLWQGVVCWSYCYPNIRKGHSTLIIWEHKVNSKRASLISFTKESPVNRVKLQKWRKSIPIYWKYLHNRHVVNILVLENQYWQLMINPSILNNRQVIWNVS